MHPRIDCPTSVLEPLSPPAVTELAFDGQVGTGSLEKRRIGEEMLVKILGGWMLAVGAFFALKVLFDILVAAGCIALIAAFLYYGWRLLSRGP